MSVLKQRHEEVTPRKTISLLCKEDIGLITASHCEMNVWSEFDGQIKNGGDQPCQIVT